MPAETEAYRKSTDNTENTVRFASDFLTNWIIFHCVWERDNIFALEPTGMVQNISEWENEKIVVDTRSAKVKFISMLHFPAW